MKLLKKITILLCFLSLIAFVSCSAEDKSGVKEGEKTFASYAGTWYGDMDGSGEKPLITINSDGSFTLISSSVNYPSSSITRNSDKSYTAIVETETITFDFSSDTQGTVDFGYGEDGILTITKH